MPQEASEKVILEIKIPRESVETPEAMSGVFAALANIKSSFFDKLLGREKPLIFEIATYNQAIHFYVCLPLEYQTYFESQLSAQYPKVTIIPAPDFLPAWFEQGGEPAYGQLRLSAPYYLPIRTYADFKETDPLSSVLGTMSRAEANEKMLIQYVILPAGSWQGELSRILTKGIPQPDGKVGTHPKAKLIEEKMKVSGLRCGIRLLTISENKIVSQSLLKNLAGSFGSVALGEGNGLFLSSPNFWQDKKFVRSIYHRTAEFVPSKQILNTLELATIYHLPSAALSGIRNIAWATKLTGEPPDNLPTSYGITEEEKQKINFFARAEFKNRLVTFGIKRDDRRKHIYIIGKTGTGKSTLIANMAINDMRNKEGLAVIDPHGDLSEILLDFVPSHRLNDVCYLDPSDTAHPFHLNPLEVKNPEHRELAASGIVAIFYKLYSYSWGPRLEYILRNAIMTLLTKPDAILAELPELLTNRVFRQSIVENIQDQVLKNFWKNEFDVMSEKMMIEAISPILNKVGQFVTSPTIRGILGHPRSTIDLEQIMNEGKIMILNLASGKLGEDNSALLGAMFVTKMQLAAMNRVMMKEEDRRDFYLYVDEFQNFATSSFIKILSEARKYRLCLSLSNQYIGQVPEEIQKAIFGNVGTLVSFLVGAEDAQILAREFGGIYQEGELVSLGNFQIINKISINNLTSRPFYAFTLPLPRSRNLNRAKTVRMSQEKFTKPQNWNRPIFQPVPPVNPLVSNQPQPPREPRRDYRHFPPRHSGQYRKPSS